ncbi:MAG: exodeoxyribonuclease VII large subunit [Deltaproteobacteria bacterium]|nr:exodeoxyribonuclease VII large subunit [Deltaproteobacteria bacterium]
MPNTLHHRQTYTVSELTVKIKGLLEVSLPFVWIYGEISNFRIPVSGHFYFTLKDENAQINAVMFRNQNRTLDFAPEDGMSITGLGRIAVYEPRGTYQIILEYLEPEGIGAIQLAFEQLKARLSTEGLFDERHKTPLPYLPNKICVLTSPTGAVVHDIIKIVNRRFPTVHIEIIPVKVQGDGAEKEIVSGLEWLNIAGNADIAILARGGGSVEDFHAFNSEDVARAIFSSEIPIISAVGHETDFTIADFVADLRAPTPSAAAEMVVPLKDDLLRRCHELSISLKMTYFKNLEYLQNRVDEMSNRLVNPKKRIDDLKLKIDDLSFRLARTFTGRMDQLRERLAWRTDRVLSNNPSIQIERYNDKLEQIKYNLFIYISKHVDKKSSFFREKTARLHALSPVSILSRGYSITRTIPGADVVRDADTVTIGQPLEVMLAKGSLRVNVKYTKASGEE